MSMKVSSARSHSKKVDGNSGSNKSAESKRAEAQPTQPKTEGKVGQKKDARAERSRDGWDDRGPGTCQPGNGTHQTTNRGRGGNGTVSVNFIPGEDGNTGVCPAPGQQQPSTPWRPPVQYA